MVAATLVMLCTRPPDAALFEGVSWLLTIPSIAIIGREVTYISLFYALICYFSY